MEEDDRLALALVDVRQTEPVDLAVARLIRESGQRIEALGRCPVRFDAYGPVNPLL
jgi:hypothetical protein